jgi:hypothetical protein
VLFADRESLGTWPFDILREDHSALLAELVVSYQADVVILDTLREAHSGEENDSTEMQHVIARLSASLQPAALVIVSHSRKPSSDGTPSLINDIRGSSYIAGKMDSIVHFSEHGVLIGGRAVEEQKIALKRVKIPGGFYWQRTERDKAKDLADLVAIDTSLESTRSKAARLVEMTGVPLGTARRMVDEAIERMSKGQKSP